MNYYKDIEVGDRIIFKKGGFIANTLSPPLKYLVDPSWDMWGWHMATVTRWNDHLQDWMILEAVWPRVREISLRDFYRGSRIRIYKYHDNALSDEAVNNFVSEVIGAKYDIFVYILTIGSELAIKYLKWYYPPRWLNSKYTCWELSEEFDGYFDKHWKSTHAKSHRYPLITNFLLRSNPVLKGEIEVK